MYIHATWNISFCSFWPIGSENRQLQWVTDLQWHACTCCIATAQKCHLSPNCNYFSVQLVPNVESCQTQASGHLPIRNNKEYLLHLHSNDYCCPHTAQFPNFGTTSSPHLTQVHITLYLSTYVHSCNNKHIILLVLTYRIRKSTLAMGDRLAMTCMHLMYCNWPTLPFGAKLQLL